MLVNKTETFEIENMLAKTSDRSPVHSEQDGRRIAAAKFAEDNAEEMESPQCEGGRADKGAKQVSRQRARHLR